MKRYPSLKDVLAQRAARRGGGPRRGMNKLEARYAERLEELRLSGVIREWKYESIKLRLGTRCWYCPDFAVRNRVGEIELHEIKAMWRKDGRERPGFTDDGLVKLKVAAEQFPMFKFFGVYGRRDGSWLEEAF